MWYVYHDVFLLDINLDDDFLGMTKKKKKKKVFDLADVASALPVCRICLTF